MVQLLGFHFAMPFGVFHKAFEPAWHTAFVLPFFAEVIRPVGPFGMIIVEVDHQFPIPFLIPLAFS
jgi:hypothetical protein